MKIAVNRSYGGFRLNKEQENMLRPFVDDDFIYEVEYKY